MTWIAYVKRGFTCCQPEIEPKVQSVTNEDRQLAKMSWEYAREKCKLQEIADQFGISRQAVSAWEVVPPNRVIGVEAVTGVDRTDLRPDIYPDTTEGSRADR
jgi:DNA-binding transcriptional regulator YdaS (Cro superfamily)